MVPGPGEEGGGRGVAEPPVLGQRGDRAEGLATLVTLDLHPAVRVHSLVSTQIGELCVALETNLAAERLDTAMYMRVLFQTT